MHSRQVLSRTARSSALLAAPISSTASWVFARPASFRTSSMMAGVLSPAGERRVSVEAEAPCADESVSHSGLEKVGKEEAKGVEMNRRRGPLTARGDGGDRHLLGHRLLRLRQRSFRKEQPNLRLRHL